MNIRNLVISTLVAVFLSVPMVAQAACNAYGQVVRLVEYSTYSLVYIKTGPLIPYTYYYQISAPELRAAARTGMTSGKPTYVSGNAASCPTSSDIRYGGLGSVVVVSYP
jgi:hypothetical protein